MQESFVSGRVIILQRPKRKLLLYPDKEFFRRDTNPTFLLYPGKEFLHRESEPDKEQALQQIFANTYTNKHSRISWKFIHTRNV